MLTSRPCWGHFINGLRQDFRQLGCELIGGDAKFCGKLLNGFGTEGMLNLLGRNWQIFSVSDPGLNSRTKALLLELRHYALHAAVLFYQAINDRYHFGADGTTDQTVLETHAILHCFRNENDPPAGDFPGLEASDLFSLRQNLNGCETKNRGRLA